MTMQGPFLQRAQCNLPTLHRSITPAKNAPVRHLSWLATTPVRVRDRALHTFRPVNNLPRTLIPVGERIWRRPPVPLLQTCRLFSVSRDGGASTRQGTDDRYEDEAVVSYNTGQILKGRVHAIDMPESLPRVQCTSQERKDAIDTLDQYLLDLEAKLTPSLEHLEMTEDVIDRLDRNVMTYLRTFTPVLDVYGSYLSGLYTPGSDLDLTLTGNTGNLRPDDVVAMLRYYHYESVRISRPMHEFVAQFIDPVTGIQCDLCLNQRLAIQNSLMIGTYVKMEPRLRPLVYALKRIARHFCIEGTRHHISSYAYTMWLITFLKMQDPPILPQLQPPPPPLLPPPEPILDPSSSSSPPSTRAPPLRVDPATLEKTVEVNGRILDRVIIEGHDCTFDDDWLRYRQTQDTSNPINITNATAATTTTTTNSSLAATTPTPSKTPGELLLTFLEQYGFEHDYVHLDLHTRTATLEPRQLGVYPLGKLPSPRLRILDPFLLDRDLGVGARINGAMRIREAFQQSVNAILAKDLELVFGEDDEE